MCPKAKELKAQVYRRAELFFRKNSVLTTGLEASSIFCMSQDFVNVYHASPGGVPTGGGVYWS